MNTNFNSFDKQLASIALSIGAIELRPKSPFKWASGTYNPIYNDNRMLLGLYDHYITYIKAIYSIILSERLKPAIICGTSLSGIAPASALQMHMRYRYLNSEKPELIILNDGKLYWSHYEVTKAIDRGDSLSATAPWAIPFGMREAYVSQKGFMYIRPKAKDHGKQKQVEGNPKEGQSVALISDKEEKSEARGILTQSGLLQVDSRFIDFREEWTEIAALNGDDVIVIEDLVSTGGSALKEVEACRKSGGNVLGVISIFNYGLDSAKKAFEEANCPVWSVLTYDTLLEVAKEKGMFSEEELELLADWRKDQPNWGAKNGFPPEEKK